MKRVPLAKTIYLFPSLCTTASLFCGFFSIIKSLSGDTFQAVWAIFFAGIFDLIDGRVARLTKTQSNFGSEYDSLADLSSFGLAPTLLVYTWALDDFYRFGWLVAFVFVACGALRLARFNVKVLTSEKKRFQGLPIPMAAGTLASYVLFSPAVFGEGGKNYGALVLTFVLSALMVSSVRYRSFKDFELKGRKAFYALLILIGLILLVGIDVHVMPFVIGISYVASGPFEEIFFLKWQRRQFKSERKVTRKMTVVGETTPWARS